MPTTLNHDRPRLDGTTGADPISRYINLVHGIAMRQTRGDVNLSADITQAVFLVYLRQRGAIRDQRALAAWFFRVTLRTAARARRAAARRRHHEQAAARAEIAMQTDSLEQREQLALLDGAIARLGRSDRDLILLRYLQGWEVPMIAALLGIAERTARKRLSRAIERLRARLIPGGNTPGIEALLGAAGAPAAPVAVRAAVQRLGKVATSAAPTPGLDHAATFGHSALAAIAAASVLALVSGVAILARGGAATAPATPPAAIATAPATAPTVPALPRYRLAVGQQLNYQATFSDPSTPHAKAAPDIYRITCTVTAATADGGWHVVEVLDYPPDVLLDGTSIHAAPAVWEYDLMPDGRAAVEPVYTGLSAPAMFPALPPRPGATSWMQTAPSRPWSYRLAAATQPSIFSVDVLGSGEQPGRYRFDIGRGLVTQMDFAFEVQDTLGMEHLKLTGEHTGSAAWASAFARQASALIAGRDRASEQLREGGIGIGQDPATYEEDALNELRSLDATVTDPLLAHALAGMIQEHPQAVVAAARLRRRPSIGRPVSSWTLADLAGHWHSLDDYHGRVLVLIFWSRGNSTALDALPLLDKLAASPVANGAAFLGINLDSSPIDARFAADQLKLHMPTLLGGTDTYPSITPIDPPRLTRDAPIDYQRLMLPGIVIIGPDGKFAGRFVGYDDHVRQAVAGQIEALRQQP